MDRVLVEPAEVGHAVADQLDEVQRIEITANLKLDGSAARQHAAAATPAPKCPDTEWTMGSAAPTDSMTRTRMALILNRIRPGMGIGLRPNVIVRNMPHAPADAALVTPAARVTGVLRVPGDKSISHRYAMLAALADGRSTIRGYLSGADCLTTLTCLQSLGVAIQRTAAGVVEIDGRGLRGLTAPLGPLDAGNSGTTMRLLSGVVAAHEFRTVMGGDASLNRRPMKRVIRPLTEMGAVIGSEDGRPPLTIDGGKLRSITHRPEVPSAQIKSAVLLAGLQAEGETTVLEPIATRDHTERAFHEFGVHVQKTGEAISVTGGQRLGARDLVVPGDVSSATFWIALAAGTPGADIEIEGVGLNPTRTAMIEIMRRAGARIDVTIDNAGRRRAHRTHPRVVRLPCQLRDRTARGAGRDRRDSRAGCARRAAARGR